MKYKPIYTKEAVKNLKSIDRKTALRVVKKIDYYCKKTHPLTHAKKLKHPAFGEYRFRIGDYRVIFDLDHKGFITILLILTIKHRGKVYENI
jgi:mRNA interferase RelE/StbE